MRYLKAALFSFLILLAVLISLLFFLLGTSSGLRTAIKLTNQVLPGNITIRKPEGRLLNHFSFAELIYADDDLTIQLKDIHLDWNITSLVNHQLVINKARVAKLLIDIKDTPDVIEKTAEVDFNLPHLPVDVQLKQLSIDKVQIKQAGGEYVLDHMALSASLNNQFWSISQSGLNYRGFKFLLNTRIEPRSPFKMDAALNFSSLADPKDGFQGEIILSGEQPLYHWEGRFKGPAAGTLHGTLKNLYEISMRVDWQDGLWPLSKDTTVSSKAGTLSVNGMLNDLTIQAQAAFDKPLKAHWNIQAQVKEQQADVESILSIDEGGRIKSTLHYDAEANIKFHGTVQSRSIDLQALDLPISRLEFESQFSGNSLQTLFGKLKLNTRYMEQVLKADVTYSTSVLSADITLGANRIELHGQNLFDWTANILLPQPSLLHPSLEGLKTTLKAHAKIHDPQKGTFSLSVSPGTYQTTLEPSPPPLSFKGGIINAELTPKGLVSKGTLTIDKNKQLDLNISLPDFSLAKIKLAEQPIQGSVNLAINSLDFLNSLSPFIEQTRGQLEMNLNLSGLLGQPQFKGSLNLINASTYLPKQDLALNPINARLTTENHQWTAQGSVQSNGQTLNLSGTGRFAPLVEGTLKINGDSFPVMKTAEYSVFISPDLTLYFKPNALAIEGSVLVPKAELKPVSFSNSINLTEDVVFVSEKKETSSYNLTTDVDIQMGDNVALNVKGLTGFLDGGIRYRQLPHSEPFAVGELRVREGKYQAYGQDLVIQEGQLFFTGSRLSNPGIRVRAVRIFKNASSDFSGSNELFDFSSGNLETFDLGTKVVAGIELSGRVDNPEVKLFSIPAGLSDADILSMILLGRPASQASKSGGQLLLTALSTMDLDSGTKGVQLINQLKQSLGFDFNIQNSSTYHSTTNEVDESTSFVLGKSITKRLYMSYNIGLFQKDSNVLTLKYILNRYFSIQVTTSDTGNGFDLLYNHTKD